MITLLTPLLARTEPGQTNLLVPMLSDAECYFRLADTNDVDGDSLPDVFELLVSHSNPMTNDTDGDGLLDGWSWTHFGHVNGLTNDNTGATNDYDNDGTNNITEQANNTDPNTIGFTLRLGNQQFNTLNATGSFYVISGVPVYAAVLVNHTNYAAAVWQLYDGNTAFNLGSTDGVYELTFGLKGRSPDSLPTWIGTSVTLDRTNPVLVITSPSGATTSKPTIQVQGFAKEQLASVNYAISNAAGIQTNLPAYLTGQKGFAGGQ